MGCQVLLVGSKVAPSLAEAAPGRAPSTMASLPVQTATVGAKGAEGRLCQVLVDGL